MYYKEYRGDLNYTEGCVKPMQIYAILYEELKHLWIFGIQKVAGAGAVRINLLRIWRMTITCLPCLTVSPLFAHSQFR